MFWFMMESVFLFGWEVDVYRIPTQSSEMNWNAAREPHLISFGRRCCYSGNAYGFGMRCLMKNDLLSVELF